MTIHSGSVCKVGQGEDGPTLAHIAAVEVALFYQHAGLGPTLAYLCQLCTYRRGETVALEKLFQCHTILVCWL